MDGSKSSKPAVLALFDAMEHLSSQIASSKLSPSQRKDFGYAIDFLKAYQGSQGTFNSYRREIERLLQWSWHIAHKSLPELTRDDIENFIYFCQQPPKDWIGTKKSTRFMKKSGARIPNPEWRPFVSHVTKSQHRKGKQPSINAFNLSQGAIRQIFAILGSYFNYCVQEEYCLSNPVSLIRQKSKFIRREQSTGKIRRLSELQWDYVIQTARLMAKQQPEQHERTLFIMSALYSMYLRISELAASERWTPLMNHFSRDSDNNWWFSTVGKGNKAREIAVSDDMLNALKHWRHYLGLTTLPTPADNTPLIPKQKGQGPISSTHYIREIVQQCFDKSAEQLQKDNHIEEAENLIEATVHWLRHTGISDDVKHRPREHVRDDAGHSSSAITDRYIDIELRERHRSAKQKKLDPDDH